MFVEKQFRKILLALWLAEVALLLFFARDAIVHWKVGDPDDQLRLVQVRDWIAGQSWWDITQYRMNSPDGGPMHWSRLVDIPLAASIIALTPFFGQTLAEQITSAIIPLLTFGVIFALVASITHKLFGKWPAIAAATFLFMLMPITKQIVPMRIDHHGWQMVMFLIGVRALIEHDRPNRSAIITGLAAATWIEISIEGLPFAVLFMGIFALRWLMADAGRERQFAYGLSALAVASIALFLATEKIALATNYCDEASPFHFFAFSAAALSAVAGLLLEKRIPARALLWFKLAICGVAAVAALAVVLLVAPQCMGDSFAGLDPLVREYWYDNVTEGLPLYAQPFADVVQEVAGILAGLIGVWALIGRKVGPAMADRIALVLLFIGCALVGILIARTSVYALCLTAILLAPLAVGLFIRADSHPGVLQRTGLRLLACVLLLPGLAGTNIMAVASRFEPASKQETAGDEAFYALARKCQNMDYIKALRALPRAQLMAGLDMSPGILQFTGHNVVATGHHRNQAAMRDVILAFTSDPQTVHQIYIRRGIEYLVSCDGSFELRNYKRSVPGGFWARLEGGEQFPWLVREPDIGVYHVWRVK